MRGSGGDGLSGSGRCGIVAGSRGRRLGTPQAPPNGALGPPLVVSSSDPVTNLNADSVDGIHGTDLATKLGNVVTVASMLPVTARRRPSREVARVRVP